MCNILICLDKQPTPELLDAIMVTLAQGGFDGIASTPGDNLTLIAKAMADTSAANSSPAASEFTIEIPPMDLPAPSQDPIADVMAAQAPEVPVAIAPQEVPAIANPAPIGLPNAVIKSLSLSTQCHAVYDPSIPDTTLKVKNVSEVGDLLVFTFGGAEYKYPMADHKINVVVSFAGKETEQISCSLVVVSTDGEDELVVGSNDQTAISTYLA